MSEAFEKWKASIPEKEYFDRNDEIKGGIPLRAFNAGIDAAAEVADNFVLGADEDGEDALAYDVAEAIRALKAAKERKVTG